MHFLKCLGLFAITLVVSAASLDCRIVATDDKIRHAHVMRARGHSVTEVASYLGITQSQTTRILKGERRKKIHPDNDKTTSAMIEDAA